MVTVYGRSDCAQCTATKRTLEIKEVEHVYLDVEQFPDVCDYLRSLGHQQLPVVIAGPAHWSGFRPDLIVAVALRSRD
ncbi:glutaredoxin domain-containing protein [Herbiconiux ginsengi]|uniref:Ribonucleoside-diphosphate reductase class Ib glutaredoxin subunit n=1 Tax=Herbiconiux ginsengi TaxID=381665 RepID=A0A1H3U270_9MICO|nr:glutaredoxin domain-containing protein [Herbiconiux ginsengi]SDZ56543.1 ribonucleoside-diphosphate reductase class Ib glutaredoxin subunit [Herbiconiux ginsengi]